MAPITFDEDRIRAMYQKVVELPNDEFPRKGCLTCPDCGEEILMIPTLKVMGDAIENHVHKHKELLKDSPIEAHRTAILVRLSLMTQTLQQSCRSQNS